MALKDFLAVINEVDLARSNRFVVEVQPPQIPGLGIKPQQQINLMCQDVTFPGQNMRTATDDLRQGPTRDIAQAVTYGNTNMTFICTPGLPEKLFFEAWQKLMYNSITWQAKYYKSYIGQIKLRQLDRTDMVRYGIILHEAYPKIINAQDYSNTATDAIQTLQVEFAFHHWSMDTEVYDGAKRYGSEGGSDQEKQPKRKVLAGTENMSAAEVLSFIRGETQNALGQTYSEAMAAAGAPAAAVSLLGANTGTLSSVADMLPKWATAPSTGKGKPGKTIDARQQPTTKFTPITKTTKKVKEVSTLGYGIAGRPGKSTGIKAAAVYSPKATQDINGILKTMVGLTRSMKVEVNKNTGQRVGFQALTSKVSGASGMFAAGMNMKSGGYMGKVASSMTGAMVQAQGLSHSTGSLDAIAGVRKQAATNVAGALSGITGVIGMGKLAAKAGAGRSGISVNLPRFGGVDIVRGAGFNIRKVSTVPRGGGRGWVNPNKKSVEGGGEADAGGQE